MSDLESTSMSTDLHRECWMMLPWVVTGRIAAADCERFERHLLECAECRAELEQQRALSDYIRRDEPVMLAPQSSLQKLLARIDSGVPVQQDGAAHAAATAASATPSKRTGAPHWLSIAAGLQAIAIAGLLMLVWQQRGAEMTAPRFATLSSTSAPSSSGAVLRVVFRPEMTNAELQELLHRVDAHVVAGPTEAGVYSLQLPAGARSVEIAQTLASVRANPYVVFAEHVSAVPAR